MLFQLATTTPVWTEDLLRRSLLAEEVIDVHFHLFTSRSKSSRRVLRPRMLNSSATLLKNSTIYFASLFGLGVIPFGPKAVDVKAIDGIFDGLPLGDYGYESDSDLEDEDDESTDEDDDGYAVNGNVNKSSSTISSPDKCDSKKFDNKIAQAKGTSLVFDKSRHIFVKDTAFQTWYCLLYYLYTGAITFSPLRSSDAQGSQIVSPNTRQGPQCSAKSMYALATKLGLHLLRDQAYAFIRKNLNEDNVLQELACSFVGRHPDVLELVLNVLAEKFATAPVIQGLPQLMRRIAKNELPHGAEILVGLHTRILQKHYWFAPSLRAVTGPLTKPTMSVSTTQAATTVPSTRLALVPSSGISTLFTSPPTASSAPAPHTCSLSTGKKGGSVSDCSKTK
ncbi:hypothetical protein EDC04DRAFT_1843815 [Pisolithus marmoratus]|nr:hypothetical protein EDC04DRAFT_1843815 [Pisolithus marmoratus]